MEGTLGGSTLDEMAESWLLSQRAKEMGMVVSDDMIRDFLSGLADRPIDIKTLKTAIRNSGLSQKGFFETMRAELAAWKLRQMFMPSVSAATPGQRWDYYCRQNRQATIEAVPVPVADYLDQIENPTDEKLKEFFEANKDKLPEPDLPAPGFKRPQRVALQYFKAEIDKFATPELIPDKEVMERYEKNKETYDRLRRSLPPKSLPPRNLRLRSRLESSPNPRSRPPGSPPPRRRKPRRKENLLPAK